MPRAACHLSVLVMLATWGVGFLAICRADVYQISATASGQAGEKKANGAATPAPSKDQPVLYLTDGDFFSGKLQDSADADQLHWQCNGAVHPFQFPMSMVRAAFLPAPEQQVPAEADFCFELTHGDRLFGSIANITPEHLEIDSPLVGRLQVERSQLKRILPWKDAAAWEYSGPSGLADWTHNPKENGWLEEAGHVLTSAPSAMLRRKVMIPEQAAVELAVSWTNKLDFVLVLAAGKGDQKQEKRGIHLEVWDNTLVLVRETNDDADLATICDLKTVKNRLHLQLLIDQSTGTVAVHSMEGAKLGEITVQAGKAPLETILIRNHRGDFRLEQLVVSKWSGQVPVQVDVARERVQRKDGSSVYGSIERFDADQGEFVVRDGDNESRVVLDDVSHIAFTPDEATQQNSARIGCHDGSRLSGQLASVAGDTLILKRAGIAEPVNFKLADIRCLIGAPGHEPVSSNQTPVGRLELAGVKSHGSLVDGETAGEASCLVWKPRHSASGSPLRADVSGRIVYRDPPPPAPKPSQQELQRRRVVEVRQQRQGVWGAVINAFTGPPAEAPATPRMPGYPHAIFLLAGDRIPCIVSHVDERGVHFSSSVVDSGFVTHQQIKALELVPRTAAASLAHEKQSRLLTLPRMQRNNPPTHLIASTGGDYLRTRLHSMDGQTLATESRLESKRFPRGRVATIIWLHPKADDADEKNTAVESVPALSGIRIQAVRGDGVRITFEPEEFKNGSLLGHSTLLGACKVDVKAVDRILLGSTIDSGSESSLYDEWELIDAVDPKFASEEGQPSNPAAGINSALIGKEAPEISLDLLDGGKFKLSEAKGTVIVLDFWASWCAPCMQGMPVIDHVVGEFEGEPVKYVAVNMQEDRTTIQGALERLKLKPAVALDTDGVASERYEVSAVPQVVIIDVEGKVARLFIGVDANFADNLRGALAQLLKRELPSGEASGE